MNNILSAKDTKAVLEILVEQLGVKESQLTSEARLQEDLGADSLTIIQIIMALEDLFHVSIPDEAAEKVSTVQDVFDAISDLIGKQQLQ